MGLFDFLGKGKKLKQEKKQKRLAKLEGKKCISDNRDYSGIVEIAKILTNNDKQAVDDMTLLANDHKAFYEKYKDWCDEMFDNTSSRGDFIFITLPYWLVGYDAGNFENPYKYGAYIDWKEATEEITTWLDVAIAKLGYLLSVEDIEFTGEEFTDKALEMINNHFVENSYTLVTLDTDSDSYHLFIVVLSDFDKLVELGNSVGIHLYNKYC